MEQKKYLIKALGSSQTKYVQSVYRNSITTNEDIGDAIEVDDISQAIALRRICEVRNNNNYELVIIVKETTIKDYEEPKIKGE